MNAAFNNNGRRNDRNGPYQRPSGSKQPAAPSQAFTTRKNKDREGPHWGETAMKTIQSAHKKLTKITKKNGNFNFSPFINIIYRESSITTKIQKKA